MAGKATRYGAWLDEEETTLMAKCPMCRQKIRKHKSETQNRKLIATVLVSLLLEALLLLRELT